MQTFLPYPSFSESARVLDSKRLNKQILEATQILRILARLRKGEKPGYMHHPAVKAWAGCEWTLFKYIGDCCRLWFWRNNPERLHKCYIQAFDIIGDVGKMYVLRHPGDPRDLYIDKKAVPCWLGNPAVHSAHRARLLAKDPEHYGQFGWTEEPITEFPWELLKEAANA
jgi:hypothetical protein